jgi:hypothetical protein
MAHEEPLVAWSQDRSEEDDEGRSYFAGGTVIADTKLEAYQSLSEAGIVVGGEWSEFPGAPCLRRTVGKHGSTNLYDWTAEFKGSGEGEGDPSDRPIYVEWREGKETLSSSYNIYGTPLLSSSGEMLEPRSHDLDTFFITIIKWEDEYDARKRLDYSNTCNSDVIHLLNYILQPGEVALRSYIPTGRIQYLASGDQVTTMVEVSYVLEVRGSVKDGDGNEILDGTIRTGFYERKADLGRMGFYINNDGDLAKGKIEVKAGGGNFSPVSSAVPLRDGVPIDPDNVYTIDGHTSDDWSEQARESDVVYDDSHPRITYILTPKLFPVPYATLLD